MLAGFYKIVEERIRVAQKNGEFDNLPGSGKPLALDDDGSVPEDLHMAYKILKNADCLPPEIELMKEIKRTEDLLTGMEDTDEKYRVLQKINFLIMKLNTARNMSIVNEMPQQYLSKLAKHIKTYKGTGSRQSQNTKDG